MWGDSVLETQNEAHLLVCNNIGGNCAEEDLDACTPAATIVAEF